MSEFAALVKIGKPEHIAQLQMEGLLYMNNLPYFWAIERDEPRRDPFDSVERVERGCTGKVYVRGEDLPRRITNWTLRIHPSEPEKMNIFCMYALRPSSGTFPLDERTRLFGDCALVVSNPQELIDRIGAHLERSGIKGEAGLVEYVDDEFVGDLGPLRKLTRFSYQSEWRLVCYEGPGDHRLIRIGSIEDISCTMPSNKINELVDTSPAEKVQDEET